MTDLELLGEILNEIEIKKRTLKDEYKRLKELEEKIYEYNRQN